MIRLMQNFSSISLDSDAQPPGTRPPASWANVKGRKSIEKFWPKSHLTMYSDVSSPVISSKKLPDVFMQGGLWVKMREAVEQTVE